MPKRDAHALTSANWPVYTGDTDLEQGGTYFGPLDEDDHAWWCSAVRVTPASDAGGPGNVWWIEWDGTLYMPKDRLAEALSTCGYDWTGEAIRDCTGALHPLDGDGGILLRDAYLAHAGLDGGLTDTVQIGKADPFHDHDRNAGPEPDVLLRGNWKLRNYVRREYLESWC